MQFLENESLKKHNTFKTGGAAKFFAQPQNREEIKYCLDFALENKLKYIIVGNGSNLLFSDDGFDGLVIKLNLLKGIEINDNVLKVQSGEMLGSIGNVALKNNLSGFEALAGIPGTLGGGIYMNCGAYGSEIKDVVKSVCFMNKNGQIEVFNKDKLEFSYRHSSFCSMEGTILWAELELEHGNKLEIEKKMQELYSARREKQPLEYPSAGSTFKRPEGYFAAKLIDDAGLKGMSVGGAKVSEKHAGFVINYNNATTTDVLTLVEKVKKEVLNTTGVALELEVRVV